MATFNVGQYSFCALDGCIECSNNGARHYPAADTHRPRRPTRLSLPTEPKSHRNLLSVIKKTLSPSSKSKESKSKPKSASPLASLLRSPAKHARLKRATSVVSPNTVRFADVKYGRSQSVSCPPRERLGDGDLLADEIPLSIDATSPDHCIVTSRKRLELDTVDSVCRKYSPSNYTQNGGKPEKDKKLGSPFQLKHRRKSSKSLFKRLLGSSPGPVEGDRGVVSIGIGQTVALSESNPNDSASQLSVDIPPGSAARRNGMCSRGNSHSSFESTLMVDSKEMAAIEAGRKVFDATSPDHCTLVDVDRTQTPVLDKTLVHNVSNFINKVYS